MFGWLVVGCCLGKPAGLHCFSFLEFENAASNQATLSLCNNKIIIRMLQKTISALSNETKSSLPKCTNIRISLGSAHHRLNVFSSSLDTMSTISPTDFDSLEIQQQYNDINNRWDLAAEQDWDNENSSARLFERSRIKALAGTQVMLMLSYNTMLGCTQLHTTKADQFVGQTFFLQLNDYQPSLHSRFIFFFY